MISIHQKTIHRWPTSFCAFYILTLRILIWLRILQLRVTDSWDFYPTGCPECVLHVPRCKYSKSVTSWRRQYGSHPFCWKMAGFLTIISNYLRIIWEKYLKGYNEKPIFILYLFHIIAYISSKNSLMDIDISIFLIYVHKNINY